MMHVAEAGEEKGRVVLELSSGAANAIAVEAAIWLARAFQSEIESLFVENQQLIELASYPFAREISFSGRQSRSLSCEDIERHFRGAASAFHRLIEAQARMAEVPVRRRVVRDAPVRALAAACAERGPWNVVALAEPFTAPEAPSLKSVLETVTDTTGVLVVGPRARRTQGPIVLVLEVAELLPVMLNAAERLGSVQNAGTTVCLLAGHALALGELEAQSRLVLSEKPDVTILACEVAGGHPAASAEIMRKLDAGLVIGQYGGLLVPDEGDLRPLAASLECPLLLLR